MMTSPKGVSGSSGHPKEVRDGRVLTFSFDDGGGILRWSSGSGEPSYGGSGSWGNSSGRHSSARSGAMVGRRWQLAKKGGCKI
jgi:hypothetical protein